MASLQFKEKYTLVERIEKYQKLRDKYPNSVPVIIEENLGKYKSQKPHTRLKCNIFCVSKDESFISFYFKLFNKLQIGIDSHTGLYLYVKDVLLIGQSFKDLQQQYQEEDGFVYITYAVLAGFG